jgi:hypothetical protein
MESRFTRFIKMALIACLCLIAFTEYAHAEDDYSADCERRAKFAGKSLVGTPALQMTIKTIVLNTSFI